MISPTIMTNTQWRRPWWLRLWLWLWLALAKQEMGKLANPNHKEGHYIFQEFPVLNRKFYCEVGHGHGHGSDANKWYIRFNGLNHGFADTCIFLRSLSLFVFWGIFIHCWSISNLPQSRGLFFSWHFIITHPPSMKAALFDWTPLVSTVDCFKSYHGHLLVYSSMLIQAIITHFLGINCLPKLWKRKWNRKWKDKTHSE